MNNNGQLGDGTTTGRREPAPVVGGRTFVRIATGILHSCALTPAGDAYCWGWNGNGQLGDGTTTNRAVPTLVAGGHAFARIDTYSIHTCALTAAGAAYCWGFNAGGMLGDGTTTDRHAPVAAAAGLTFTEIATTAGESCGLAAGGAVHCWGAAYGPAPVAVAGVPPLTSLSAGGGHICGLTVVGAAYCWGANQDGQLGDGTTTSRAAPQVVAGDLSFAALSATGWRHACGVTLSGRAYCWGDNSDGQLGDGTGTSRLVPTPTVNWRTGTLD
jgi:alpha-tubulin suppressor-like RCC1 family protein